MYRLPPLTDGRIVKRYKRFLADVQLEDGSIVTAHCPNTGAMTTCWAPGVPVQLSYSDNPRRKLAWTLERVDMGRGWIGVNTARVNHIIAAAIRGAHVEALAGYDELYTEPSFEAPGYPRSRFDILLRSGTQPDVYVEIKNTTLLTGDGIAFPDAVTKRGYKHLELLTEAVKLGFRGVILYALNRPEGRYFEPAWDIDPEYGHALQRASANGVEILLVRLRHLLQEVEVAGTLAVDPHRPTRRTKR